MAQHKIILSIFFYLNVRNNKKYFGTILILLAVLYIDGQKIPKLSILNVLLLFIISVLPPKGDIKLKIHKIPVGAA